MKTFLVGFAVILLLASPNANAAEPSEETMAKNIAAQELGQQMYLHDQAAWHGTDALRELVDVADHPELRGYVVDPMSNGNLGLVFYAEDTDGFHEFARFEVAGSKVVGGGLISGERKALSPLLERLIAARNKAVDHAVEQKWGLCSRTPPNFIMLPPDANDRVRVFLLTSTDQEGLVPFGGHFRIDVNADGSVANSRKFTNSCLNLTVKPSDDGTVPAALGVSHILDDHPTEIHYFQSHYATVDIFVIAPDHVWAIDKGQFREIVEMDLSKSE